MPEPIEVEVVEIDGAAPPPRAASDTRGPNPFRPRFVRLGPSPLSWILGALVGVIVLVFALLALVGFVLLGMVRGIARFLFPGSHRPGSLSAR